MLLVSKLPSWLVSYQEYGHGWMSIPNLEKMAVSQNNAVAWNYVQSARQAHRREQEAGAHVTLFLLFLLLDWYNPHSLQTSAGTDFLCGMDMCWSACCISG
ncbi:hypothetical protein NR402_07255 [Acidithiobacillus ferrooxidans]|jgi:hypothetical protein|uniref:hypothetical protein n=1 Tax=Acidithiobacillus ferrooxidans TaxID=920 RepID=UPI00214C19B5|nr:hypothetical protein [Acidithiobacillus ferrooxidans]MCR2830077.1 hypothetical protein [Acidithiobacillus ferrooxidans]